MSGVCARRLRSSAIPSLVVAIGVSLVAEPRQGWSGLQPGWQDLETWSRRIESSSQSEVGLGLVLSGPSGTVSLAFAARTDAAVSSSPRRTLQVLTAVGPLMNPNVVRRPSLMFRAALGGGRQIVFDLSNQLVVDDPSPGAYVRSGIAPMSTDQFSQLLDADTIDATVLGSDVVFRPNQIDAMRRLAERLQLKKP